MSFLRDVSTSKVTRRLLVAHGSAKTTRSIACIVAQLEGVELAGIAHKLTQTLAMTEVVRPDVILFDQGLAGGNLAQVIGWIKHKVPAASVVILSTSAGSDLRLHCLEAGADYFCKETAKLSGLSDILEQFDHCCSSGRGRFGL